MAGFPLMAFGAGLGKFAEQYQQQQDARQRNQMTMLTLLKFQQEMQERQEKLAGDKARWELNPPGSPIAPISPLGGGAPAAPASQFGGGLPAASSMAPPATSAAGGGDQGALVRKYESNNNYNIGYGGTDLSSAPLDQYGFPQWAGKMGPAGMSHAAGAYQFQPATWRQYAGPLGVRDFSPASQDKVFEAARADQGMKPWAPYNPRLAAALGSGEGGGTGGDAAPPARPVQMASMDPSGQIPGYPSFRPGAPGQADRNYVTSRPPSAGSASGAPQQISQTQPQVAQQQSTPSQAAPAAGGAPPDLQQMLDRVPKPDLRDRTNEQEIKARINQAYPTLPPTRKLEIFKDELEKSKVAQADQAKLAMKDYDTRLQAALETWKEQNTRMGRALEGGDLMMSKDAQGNPILVRQKGGGAAPVTMGGQPVRDATRLPEAAKDTIGKPQLLEYTDADGKVQRVMAQQMGGPDGGQWVSADQTRTPIDVSKGKWSIVPGGGADAMGGGRDAAQRERQLISAREVVSDLRNVVALPISANRGIFGGRTQGPGLMDALKENLAERMTDEDAQLVNSALAGIGRELSIVVSPVYGGKWASDSFAALTLKDGQTNLVKLYNIARMRQTVDNSLETISKSPRIGDEQKAFAQEMRQMMDEAVPWTPADVIAFRKSAKKGETFSEFVLNKGLGGAAERKKAAASGRPGAAAAPASTPLPSGGATAPIPPAPTTYRVGETIDTGGKRYRVIRIDPAKPDDPEIEEVK